MAAPLTYANLDHNDRHFFDHDLADDFERFAFIRFFEHVEQKDSNNRRPRTGRGRVKLWSRSSRADWVRRARVFKPLPEIMRPTWIQSTAGASPAVSPPSFGPIARPQQALTLVAPVTSSIVSIAPVVIPPPHPLVLSVPAPGSTVETVPAHPVSPHEKNKKRDIDSTDLLEGDGQPIPDKRAKPNVESTDIEHSAISHLTDIGGEKCPQFVLYNEVEDRNNFDAYKALPPSKEQRQFVQEALGGRWRFAKALHQHSTRAPKQGSRAGIPDVSTFLFAKVNNAGLIEERAVIKCRDVSIKNDASHGQVEREATATNALRATNCRHFPQSTKMPEGLDTQSLHFSLEGLNDQSSWKLDYQASEYASHGTLRALIKNHESAKQPIPEHFCWFVFGSIVEALITCQTGYCSDVHTTPISGGSLRPEWRRMLHLDINPRTVFLSGPDSNYDFYQQPILGSFDTALCLDLNPAKHEAQFGSVRFKGTKYWQAPEQCMQYAKSKQYPPSKWELDHATDVYSLGLLIRYMMMCTQSTPEELDKIMKWEADNFENEAKDLPNTKEYEFDRSRYPSGYYSSALKDTVQCCLAFRSKFDPEKPNKKYRPTLFKLRDIINEQLAQKDEKWLSKIEQVQANTEHKMRVIFSDEDSRFAIGTEMPPVPQVDVAQLIDAGAIGRDKKQAREIWDAYLANASKEPSSVSTSAMSAIFEDVVERTRVKLFDRLATEPDRRPLYLNALYHATNTIQKCINPTGRFKQLRQQLKPDFFAPRNKRIVLKQMLGFSKIVLRETRAELQNNFDIQNDMERELTQAEAKLEAASSARYRDEDIIKTLTANLQFLQEKQELKYNQAAVLQDKISSLELLRDATDIGNAILIFGSELWPGEELTEEQGHWMPKLSMIHKGIWEYFWARPDGVFADKVDDDGDDIDGYIIQALAS